MVILILVFISVLGMSSIAFMQSRILKNTLETDRLKAYYLAEAGLAQAIHELKEDKDMDGNGLGTIKPTELGGGIYKASHNLDTFTIIGYGEYNDIERRVQIQYQSL